LRLSQHANYRRGAHMKNDLGVVGANDSVSFGLDDKKKSPSPMPMD